MRRIETEEEFYVWLTRYMKEAGPCRTYPTYMVEFAEFLTTQVPDGLDNSMVREYLGGNWSHMGALFEKVGRDRRRTECSTHLIRYAGLLFYEANFNRIDIECANRLAVMVLDLGSKFPRDHGYFKQVWDHCFWRLKSTKKFEQRFDLRVNLIQEREGEYSY